MSITDMESCSFTATRLDDTDRLGGILAEVVPDATTIALCGTLGAGKTRLVQAIAAACQIPRESVVSPTFVLCQEYHGTRMLYHLDAYRLRDAEEFRQLGVEELFGSQAIVLIEWADRVEAALPTQRLEIGIELGADDVRQFCIRAHGEPLHATVAEIFQRLSAGGMASAAGS